MNNVSLKSENNPYIPSFPTFLPFGHYFTSSYILSFFLLHIWFASYYEIFELIVNRDVMVVCVLYGCCRVEYRNHNCSSFPLESGLLSGFEKIPLPTPSPTPQTGHVKCIHLILDNSYTGYLVGEPWGKVHQPVTGRGEGGG